MLLPLLLAAASLPQQMEQIAAAARGHTGAAVLVVETGRSASFHGQDRFPMQSVYKFPIGMAVLHRVDQGALSLDQKLHVAPGDLVPAGVHSPLRDKHPQGNIDVSVSELLRLTISESDGAASDVLMRAAGGAGSVTQYLRSIGAKDIVVATTESAMAAGPMVQYRNWVTPVAAVGLLKLLQQGRGLSPRSRTLLLDWMTGSSPGPKRIKGLLPPGTEVAHKTGTSGTSPDGLTRATNDVGLVTLPDGNHLAIAVFVSDSRASTEIREEVIAKIARAAWDWSSRQ